MLLMDSDKLFACVLWRSCAFHNEGAVSEEGSAKPPRKSIFMTVEKSQSCFSAFCQFRNRVCSAVYLKKSTFLQRPASLVPALLEKK